VEYTVLAAVMSAGRTVPCRMMYWVSPFTCSSREPRTTRLPEGRRSITVQPMEEVMVSSLVSSALASSLEVSSAAIKGSEVLAPASRRTAPAWPRK
jgi:hypothetical protein